jgi:hypothetical protein
MDNNWINFKKNNNLFAHNDQKGNIKEPSDKWSYFLNGNIRDVYTSKNKNGEYDLIYTAAGCVYKKNWKGEEIYRSKPFGIEGISCVMDLDEDGTLEIVACNGKELLVFSDEDGRLLYKHYFGPPRSSGAAYSMIIAHKFDKTKKGYQVLFGLWSAKDIIVYDFSEGAEKGKVLHNIIVDDGFHPTVLAADIDCDGEDEIIVTKRGGIYFLDYKTGILKKKINWISGGERRRNYGLFEIKDVNDDNIPECLVVSSLVTRHLSVIANDGKGNLSVLWDKFVEHIYPTDTTEVRFVYNTIKDVDGDGRDEMVVSKYNVKKDNRWYTLVIDPLDGNVKYEIPDTFLWGVNDFDNDNVHEIFLSKEFTRMPADYSELMVLKIENGKIKTIAEHKNSRFAGRFINSISPKAIFRTEFLPEEIWFEDFGEAKSYLTFVDGEKISIFAHSSKKQNSLLFKTDEKNLTIGAVGDFDNDKKAEIAVISDKGCVRLIDSDGKLKSTITASTALPYGLFAQTRSLVYPIAFRANEKNYLLTPTLDGDMILFIYNEKTGMPEICWKKKLFGKRCWNTNLHTPYAFYKDNETLLALASNDKGYPVLNILTLEGEILKSYDFKGFPLSKHNNRLGLYEWQVIKSNIGYIIIASLYSSTSMNSEETICLDYETGKIIWQRKEVGEGDFGRGFGPYGFLSTLPGKDKTDAYLLAKDTFCHIIAETGEFIGTPFVLQEFTEVNLREKGVYDVSDVNLATNTDPFTAYGSVTVIDINNDGENELVLTGCFNAFGVLDKNHKPIWWRDSALADQCMRYAGLTDIDNDGVLELGVSHLWGDFVCYSILDGKEKWRMPLGAIASDMVSCDIDGDGFNEYIFGVSDGRLIALGDKGKIKWQMDFGTSTGNPVIFDFDGDGKPEIFVVSGDSHLHWIK